MNEVTPCCEWVLAGEGKATKKHDGTCCLLKNNILYKRYELLKGKNAPKDFEPCTEFDEITGKQQGWVPVGYGPEDQWHRAAADALAGKEGTYELCGPKIQGNPEGLMDHRLIQHGYFTYDDVPRTFEGLKSWLEERDIEGLVFYHPDGRMAKIKKKDF